MNIGISFAASKARTPTILGQTLWTIHSDWCCCSKWNPTRCPTPEKYSRNGLNQWPFAILMESCSQTFQKHPVLQQHSLTLTVSAPWQTIIPYALAFVHQHYRGLQMLSRWLVKHCYGGLWPAYFRFDPVVCNLSNYWRLFQMHEHLWAVCKLYMSMILKCKCDICSICIWI